MKKYQITENLGITPIDKDLEYIHQRMLQKGVDQEEAVKLYFLFDRSLRTNLLSDEQKDMIISTGFIDTVIEQCIASNPKVSRMFSHDYLDRFRLQKDETHPQTQQPYHHQN